MISFSPFLFLLLAAAAGIRSSYGLCQCDVFRCESPSCCDSGLMHRDPCGCCNTCVKKNVNDVCGGHLNRHGMCSGDLKCLKECNINQPKCTAFFQGATRDCVFPFIYKGQSYSGCTTVDSPRNPWCAITVDGNGATIRGQWGDCQDGCFREGGDCPDSHYKFAQGKCIAVTFDFDLGGKRYRLEEGSSNPVSIQQCRRRTRCYCSNPTPNESGCASSGQGWCYLENVDDSSPTRNCYPDVRVGASSGRYYSYQICQQEYGR